MFRKWFDQLDQRYARICIYASVTAVLTFIAGLLVWHSWGFLGIFWNFVCLAFQPLIYGSMICYLLQPAVNFFSGLLARRDPAAEHEQQRVHLAVIITIATLVLILVLVVIFALLVVTQSIGGVNMENLTNLLNGTTDGLRELIDRFQAKLNSLGLTSVNMTSIVDFVGDASMVFTVVMLSAVFGVYFLFDGERAGEYGKRFLRALLGDRHAASVERVLTDADRVFSGYVRGQFIDAISVGLLMVIALMLVRVPFAPFIGLIAGVANLIPFGGGLVGYVLVAVSCLSEGLMARLIWGMIAVTVVMFIDGNYISPRLLANTLTFHPMLVLVALTLGSTVGGPAGMLVAVPLFAFIKQKIDEWVDARLAERELIEGGAVEEEAETELG